jgi:hypothetical protein
MSATAVRASRTVATRQGTQTNRHQISDVSDSRPLKQHSGTQPFARAARSPPRLTPAGSDPCSPRQTHARPTLKPQLVEHTPVIVSCKPVVVAKSAGSIPPQMINDKPGPHGHVASYCPHSGPHDLRHSSIPVRGQKGGGHRPDRGRAATVPSAHTAATVESCSVLITPTLAPQYPDGISRRFGSGSRPWSLPPKGLTEPGLLPGGATPHGVLENVLGSAVPAFIVTALVSGKAGVRDLTRRSLRWRGRCPGI